MNRGKLTRSVLMDGEHRGRETWVTGRMGMRPF